MSPADLNPAEVAVLEVVRRCAAANLRMPNTPTITQLSGLKAGVVRLALLRLVDLGYLAGGGRGHRGYALTDQSASGDERPAA